MRERGRRGKGREGEGREGEGRGEWREGESGGRERSDERGTPYSFPALLHRAGSSTSSSIASSLLSPPNSGSPGDQSASPGGLLKGQRSPSMPPPTNTPARLQTLKNQTLKLHFPGSGRNYVTLSGFLLIKRGATNCVSLVFYSQLKVMGAGMFPWEVHVHVYM